MEPIKWNDEKIEQFLKNLPPIKDRQSKQDLYLKIQASINYKQTKGKRSIPSWGLPALATACALVLFGVFAPDLVNNNSSNSKMEFKRSESGKMESQSTASFDRAGDQSDAKMSLKSAEMSNHFKYHGQKFAKDFTGKNMDWVTVSYMDEQAQIVVPVSFITKKSNYLEKVNDQLVSFKPTELGLSDSPLNRAKLSEEEETVIIDWPPGVIFESEENLLDPMLSFTFNNKKYKAEFRTNGQAGYEFPNIGRKNEMALSVPGSPFYRFDTPTTDTFIVSLYSAGKKANEMPKDVKSAINEMDDDQERGLKPLLPKDMELKIEITGKHSIEVTFPDSYKLSEEKENNIMMIDGILLTAESYGYHSVKFNIPGTDSVGPYQLNEPIKDITGINFIQ
ncbi:hypothetical protein [Fictibacillus barbaricus]|uniref:DUF4179 domain-containing protein n=1 Tax=Fictibacillus barbaricus TaxID=182136 RepID=A0ABU1U633_9BACL|nr:hypothetical protein [Fictibacillus barbaricus]MDR7074927.1 hypothetical protein [Fictibacillus barbaricus]